MKGFALTNHMITPAIMSIGAIAVYIGLGGIELALHSFWLAIAIFDNRGIGPDVAQSQRT